MKRRHKIALLILIPIALLAIAADIFNESDLFMEYASSPIKLGNQTIYVKARDCGAICREQLWISQNPDRCVHENPTRDYLGPESAEIVTYAVRDRIFYLIDDPRSWQRPSDVEWLHPQFITEYGHTSDSYPIRHIYFGSGELPAEATPGVQVEFRPCVRFLGHTWN
jgi:hypothetical protein